MTQATTPTFILTLPETVDLTRATKIVFSLTQGVTSIKKEVTTQDPHSISISLSQSETLMLNGRSADIQLNWVYSDGSRACTNIEKISVEPNLLRTVIE